ncbi:neprilysin-21-like [Ixodes scapularis]|uniref:neprilysin-21-like n=1 Tax=Ixodes scapularis TaxID=6945 RepID=UPI001C383E2E|nr:neprilysin-21-like [Ixodes scapularis]
MIEPEGQKVQGLQFAATGTRVLQAHRGTPAIKKELCLYPLAVFIVLFTTAFFVLLLKRFYLGDGFKLERTMLPEMCRAINCVQEANYLSKLLSLALDPCDNFYRFVCDRSTREYSILRDVHEGPTDRYVGKLEAMMYPLLTSGNQTDVAPVLRSLFNQCSNEKKVVEDGWKPVLELMSRVSLQGFPLTSPIEDVSVWKVAAKLLRKTGTAAFLSVSVTSHPSTRKDIASLDLPEALSMISGVEMSEIIRIYTKSVFYAVSVLAEKQVPSVHMLNVVRFASELEKLYQNHSINRTSQLKKFDPESPLHYFLSEVFANVPGIVYASGGNSEVIINAPEFCSELQRLVDSTEPHIVMNFLGVRLLIHIAPFLPWPDLHDVFSSLVYQKSRFGVERWRFCLRAVEQALPSLFLQFSLLAIGNRRLIAMSTKLVTAIKREFLSNIHSTTHLNNASKTVIQVLISTTTFKIMGASWIYNKNLDMQIDDPALYKINSALHSYVSVQEMAFMTKIARGSSNRWPLSAFSTDCWYESGSRTIYVPMLIFSVSLRGSDTSQIAQAGIWIGRCIFYMLLYVANSKNISGQWLSDEARYVQIASRLLCPCRCSIFVSCDW